ncbi:MAG: hypothetical protein NTV34_04885 [Proteobacteria bacterium]|nr:hypothetical protein [Pseudomonadota bacterium]
MGCFTKLRSEFLFLLSVGISVIAQTASAIELNQKVQIIDHARQMIGTQLIQVIPKGAIVSVLKLDAQPHYWFWTSYGAAGKSPVMGWVEISRVRPAALVQNIGGSGRTFELPLIKPVAGPTGIDDPHYNPERSAFNPDGTLNPSNVLRNETLYGTPYDANNLQETLVYCTLFGCD